ncbi:hypothetical protein HMPREF9011_00997 [Bacteroides sp. 3_1_40A]|nr:hypothetical protein HMPREF9011_00997 [Bacteroides sp. 3_1_40A]
MARIIGTRGYVVDVVDYMNRNAKLKFNYDMVVGLIPRGIDIYTKHMNPGCLRIAYLTSMNLAITTGNEKIRLDELKQRRGIELSPRRGSSTVIGKEIEQFDGAWYIGNKYNFHSYDCFKMPPSFRIVNSGYAFDWAKENIERDSKSFVFFASLGQVHKGLDLLLELFSQHLKDYTLYVCSGYEQEEDFYQEYHKELYETSNIIPMGFVDIESETFREISYKCTFAILPSCAEGCAGSILTAMSAGMIPIVSKECGFEDDEVINLPDCKMETIFGYVVEYSQKDQNWLKNAAKHSMEIVHSRYSKLCFSHSVEKALDGVLANTK